MKHFTYVKRSVKWCSKITWTSYFVINNILLVHLVWDWELPTISIVIGWQPLGGSFSGGPHMGNINWYESSWTGMKENHNGCEI